LIKIAQSTNVGCVSVEWTIHYLTTFLRKLPPSAVFNIVSFGTTYTPLFKEVRVASKDVIKSTISQVSQFTANMGGTELLQPLEWIFKTKMIPSAKSRFIFVLTDGEIDGEQRRTPCLGLFPANGLICFDFSYRSSARLLLKSTNWTWASFTFGWNRAVGFT